MQFFAKSFQFFINCKDNHKAWQGFEVFLHGTIMELIRLYCAEAKSNSTPLGFLQWQHNCTNPTLKMVLHLTLTIGLGIYVQRIGDRNNDVKCSNAGRYKFLGMFYGFNHPIYREVEYTELKNSVLYPQEVATLRNRNITFRGKKSTSRTAHQGGDFKLEERIKSMKRIAPKGKVTKETWVEISRSVDNVGDVVDHGRNLLNYSDSGAALFTDVTSELVEYRAILRHSNYLRSDSERAVNTDGQILNPCMNDLRQALEEKRKEYFELAKTVNLENIKYDNLQTAHGSVIEELLYQVHHDADDE